MRLPASKPPEAIFVFISLLQCHPLRRAGPLLQLRLSLRLELPVETYTTRGLVSGPPHLVRSEENGTGAWNGIKTASLSLMCIRGGKSSQFIGASATEDTRDS